MRIFLTAFFTISLIFVISCSLGVLKQKEIDPWLITISGNEAPAMDINGKWRDAKGNFMFGWGEGHLRQEENKISGAIGNYNIKGIVSGKKVYLVFLHGGAVYYTARLEMFEEGELTGNYFEADDKEQKNGYPTAFSKIAARTTQ